VLGGASRPFLIIHEFGVSDADSVEPKAVAGEGGGDFNE